MRVLQVIHDFLPNHQAGSELYCYHLSKALQRRGHEVRLFFSEIDHERPAFSTRRGDYDGLPFVEIVNNHSFASFEETYLNPNVEKAFGELLNEFNPDIVHFHHLHSLSYGCVRMSREFGAATVFTLHDYWLTCPRGGGQRFRGEGDVCHTVDPRLCAECVSRYAYASGGAGRLAKRVLNRLDRPGDETLLSAMQRSRIQTPSREYVARAVVDIEGDRRDALFAHPPSVIELKADVPENGSLQFAVAMDPSTYDKPGEGVLFRIRCNGETLYEMPLNPKEIEGDRGWRAASIDLSEHAGRRTLVFETEPHPGPSNEYCAACWAEPRLLGEGGAVYTPTLASRARSWFERVAGGMQRRRLTSQVQARRDRTMSLFDEVDLFIAPSPFLKTKFIEYGMPEDKIVFSDYGIADLGYAGEPEAPKRPVRFTYVGTVVEHKGLHVLIDAFNRLAHDGAILNVYGSLGEFSDYARRVRGMIAHPGVRLRGRAENSGIPAILRDSDALIVPSIWFENSPITIHEAFLARVPVITSRFGGMADLVKDGVNGLLFEVGDADSLTQCLQRCVDDPELLQRIKPDPISVKGLDEDAEWMEEQYRRLLEGARDSRA